MRTQTGYASCHEHMNLACRRTVTHHTQAQNSIFKHFFCIAVGSHAFAAGAASIARSFVDTPCDDADALAVPAPPPRQPPPSVAWRRRMRSAPLLMAAGGWRRAGGKATCRRRAFIHHRGKEVPTLCALFVSNYFFSVPFYIGQQSSQTSLTLLLGALRLGRSVNTKTAAAAVASKKGKPAEPAYDAAQIQARTASAL